MLKGTMDYLTQKQWAKGVVETITLIFPEIELTAHDYWQKYLPHAQDCTEHIKQWNIILPAAMQLLNRLNQAGFYLWLLAQYEQAEPLYQQILAAQEQVLEPQHPDLATSLHNLALLYRSKGKYEQAEALFKRALEIREHAFGREHADVASSLHELAWLYRAEGKYAEAETL